ncbi:ergothioneine biosynthesis glutamate--cysteine ligase EgtA [Spirillospora sp. NPDC052269]
MIENSRRLHPDDVRRHVVGTCFKTGPPGTVGAETEWFVADPREPGAQVPAATVRAAVEQAGPPPGGSAVTYEPGGQLELSSAPFPGLAPLHRALAADIAHIRDALAPAGLVLTGHGVDPHRPPGFQAEHPRYLCQRDYYVARGFAEAGPQMMCSTASVQVNLDIGADEADAARRWRLAHALGPVLVAAFANSPRRAGRRTGWASTRQAIWAELDPCRTGSVLRDAAESPADAWTRYALAARVMLVRGPGDGWTSDPGFTFGEWLDKGEPTLEDLEYHLSTLFPQVRPRGWFELRMIDALPEPYWAVPVAVATALLDDPRASAAAEAATARFAEAATGLTGPAGTDWWLSAARHGLAEPVIAAAARACFDAALSALPRMGASALVPVVADYTDRFVERGLSPAFAEETSRC